MNKLYYGDNLDILRKARPRRGRLTFVILTRRLIRERNYNQIYNNIGLIDN